MSRRSCANWVRWNGRSEPDQTAPPLSNTNKAKMIKQRGQEAKRQALCRMSGVHITQTDAIGVETVEVVLSEYGCDLSRFPTEKHFVSHVTLAPHVPQSGGKPTKKKKRNKVRWGQPYVNQGAAAYENRHPQRRITSLMPKAKELGYQLTPARA